MLTGYSISPNNNQKAGNWTLPVFIKKSQRMDTLQRINKTEREISALKFKIKDLRAKFWQQAEHKTNNQQTAFEPIQQVQNQLKEKREELAKLIVEQYNLAI